MDLKESIAKAKAEIEASVAEVQIDVGGTLYDVAFRMVAGHVWADLTAQCPPRQGAKIDANVGFNSDVVARVYPLDHIAVGGEAIDAETWAELMEVVASPAIKGIALVLWRLNQIGPAERAVELGKARAGAQSKKRRSPANSGSRRND
jgi:hypothetical protein